MICLKFPYISSNIAKILKLIPNFAVSLTLKVLIQMCQMQSFIAFGW